MPIYEYKCQDCGRRSSILLLRIDPAFVPSCRHCQSQRVSRLISKVAVLRSEESRLESLADPSRIGDLDEEDPKSVARWMKRMGKEVGEDIGEDFEQMVDQAMEEEGEDGGKSNQPEEGLEE